ncbi:DUF4124 domain-containing protein [Saezia sanguinis]|uniref:DUF4124 domain-containing protein n=1 Tax=Saezia sanguinis TaxID=1965230 RepID=UPI0030DC760C
MNKIKQGAFDMFSSSKSRTNHRVWASLIGAVALSFSAATFAQWKWIDSNGVTQYTDAPPPASTPAQNILTRPSNAPKPLPAATTPQPAQPEVDDQTRRLEERLQEQERQNAERQALIDQANAAEKARACAAARQSLDTLSTGMRIRETNEKGEYVYLDEAQIAAKRQDAQNRVNEYCN